MKFHHLAISVADLEKSVRFYKELGFEEVRRFTKPGWNGDAAVLSLGPMQLEIFGFKDYKENTCNFSDLQQVGLKHMGIEVESVHKVYAQLRDKGADIDEPVKGTTCEWFCFLRDPDGIPIELYESK